MRFFQGVPCGMDHAFQRQTGLVAAAQPPAEGQESFSRGSWSFSGWTGCLQRAFRAGSAFGRNGADRVGAMAAALRYGLAHGTEVRRA